MEVIKKISNGIYQWVLDTFTEDYSVIYQYDGGGKGMLWCFWALMAVSLVAVLIYYFAIIKGNQNMATRVNYLTTFVLGIVTVVVVDIVVLKLCQQGNESPFFTMNLLKMCLLNVVYYIVMFEVWSLAFRSYSDDPKRDLISCFKNK